MASEFYSFKALTLQGKEVSMEEFKGKKNFSGKHGQ
jgi:hypothetical protein